MPNLKIIDLTYDIEDSMLKFTAPWHPEIKVKQLGKIDVEGRETREITFGTHTGTHMDAPKHFIKDGKSIDQISLSKIIGKVSIFDFSFLLENECITADMLKKLSINSRVIFKFGWGKNWGNDSFFKNWPYFTTDAISFLISKGIIFIGMDTPSPDDSRIQFGSLRDSENHKQLLKNEVVIVEYIANLDKISDYEGWNLIAMPLKIKGSDGSPARICIYKEEE